MKKYMFFPGCSSGSTAKSYLDSFEAISEPLGLSLQEIEDWNCCGATEYPALHRLGSYALQGRNLALAVMQAKDTRMLATPCSACYLNMAKTDHAMREDPALAEKVNRALAAGGLNYVPGTMDVHHILDVVMNDVGLDEIKSKVVKPLTGLKVAAYYGCVAVRPDYDNHFGGYEYPTMLEELIEGLGAEAVDYPLSTHCCSGHMPSISKQAAYGMIRELIDGANTRGADLMVTICPMCQMNIDAYQADINRFFKTDYHMPIVYFTQLIGLALGISPYKLGFGREAVNAGAALRKIGSQPVEAPTGGKPIRKKNEGLPMPKMPAKVEVKA